MGEFAGLRQRVLHWLASNVPESRVEHVLRVEQMAAELARRHGVEVSKATQAGLMHDLAKNFKPQVLLEIARSEALITDPVDELNPHLLHADVSAVVARDEFGIRDPEVLTAIANHTLGRPGMDPLSCVVFLADSLEPGRGSTPELDILRQVSQQDLHKAVWMTCNHTLSQLIANHRLIHPRAVATRNWFLQRARPKTVASAS
ncbi:bis(5'-nucleosyl)-tetraphosphatase (symmetrical) YqeK [Leptolyngbya sp. 7M]|uniref:bis(5'-nucleosyl)-tetraphosphatase (symmetrical) YqeK n=1 Tax=Leptolyngbya sp. 7M TaxID=2812896 RepID=UPI001B8BA658|nr:bis(5'-nucleosyl)-tetraphosphatase (symmetrical) YqeK [Leptolyngbya sp. 7M]QYO65137.1 bis(5'-nucleosyl)-tetraphosphatase (symmetrical) YqeK [Leptolyngbya sp. 7M]